MQYFGYILTHLIPICYTWHLITDTWYLTPVLDMLLLKSWSLTLDNWHRYLTCYHLTPDTWYMTLDNWHAITHLTCFHMTLAHLTWYCDTWLDTITPDTGIIFPIHAITFTGIWHDYYIVTRHLVLLNSCIPCTHVPCTVTLVNSTVIPASGGACLVSGWRECIPRSC